MNASLTPELATPDQVTLLPELYDIEKTFSEVRESRTGEPKKMIAWWNGRSLGLVDSVEELESLPPRLQNETTASASGVSHAQVAVPQQARFGIRCVAINAGDGFKPLQASELEYALRRALKDSGTPSAQHQPYQGPMADLRRWLTDELDQITNLCDELERIDPSFAQSKSEHEAKNDPHGWPPDDEIPHTMKVAIDARFALNRLEKMYASQSWRAADRRSTGSPYGFAPLVIRIAKCAYHAGGKMQELRSITASFRTLSTLGAAKNVKKIMGSRSKFILEQDVFLTKKLKRKPSTVELMKHLDGLIDPESGEKITSGRDEDDTWEIRWADDDKNTQKVFASKVSELRRKKSK